MATSGSIEDIRALLRSNINEQYNKLNSQWSKDIEESNNLLSNIEQDEKLLENSSLKIVETIDRLNKELDYYSELGINLESVGSDSYNFPEIRRNLEKNYRTLSLIWYKHNFEELEKQFNKNQEKLNKILEKQEEIEIKTDKTDEKIESLGATFLNIVLTISITTTMVTVLLNSSPEYSLAIILGCAWLLLTSIIFISSYFKTNKKTESGVLPIIIYVVLTILTVLSFFFGWFESNEKKKDNIEKMKVADKDCITREDNFYQKSQ